MSKQVNPFLTLEDVVATLETLGTNPLCKEQNWTSNILGITIDKKYTENCDGYYVTNIHINLQGFTAFVKASACDHVITRQRHECSCPYDRLEIVLSDTLTLCSLISTEEEFAYETVAL